MAKPTQILVVEDPTPGQESIKRLLEAKGDGALSVVGQARNAAEAVAFIKSAKPQVVLVSANLPGSGFIRACQLMRQLDNQLKIIVITAEQQDADIFKALNACADGYCLQPSTTEKLRQAIEFVLAGDFWLDSLLARQVVTTLLSTLATATGLREQKQEKEPEDDHDLSPRELEVLHLVAHGLSNHKIAERLAISGETVKCHIRNIMKKMTATDRTQAAVKALRQGLI